MSDEIQAPLFAPEVEDAFFLPKEELYRRHTGKAAAAIEERRELILMALIAGWPVTTIEAKAHVSRKTIAALWAAYAERSVDKLQDFGKMLHGLGARWYALAKLKEGDAPFLHLAQAASYVTQRGTELLASAEVQMGEVLDVEEVPSETRAKVIEWAKGEGDETASGDKKEGKTNAS
jgi:hypothetical protein